MSSCLVKVVSQTKSHADSQEGKEAARREVAQPFGREVDPFLSGVFGENLAAREAGDVPSFQSVNKDEVR